MNLNNELNLAKIAAKQAGDFLISEKDNISATIYSKDKDIKLQADIQTEALIKSILEKDSSFPILGEESGASVKELGKTYWVVDPLDGTANFARNIPISCVSIALISNNLPVLGVIYDFNHEGLSIMVDISLPPQRVIRELETLAEWCCRPDTICSDNGAKKAEILIIPYISKR